MARKSKRSSSSKHKGYGIHNVARRRVSKDRIRKVRAKKWDDVTCLDLNLLYDNHWKTSAISQEFDVSLNRVLGRLCRD